MQEVWVLECVCLFLLHVFVCLCVCVAYINVSLLLLCRFISSSSPCFRSALPLQPTRRHRFLLLVLLGPPFLARKATFNNIFRLSHFKVTIPLVRLHLLQLSPPPHPSLFSICFFFLFGVVCFSFLFRFFFFCFYQVWGVWFSALLFFPLLPQHFSLRTFFFSLLHLLAKIFLFIYPNRQRQSSLSLPPFQPALFVTAHQAPGHPLIWGYTHTYIHTYTHTVHKSPNFPNCRFSLFLHSSSSPW